MLCITNSKYRNYLNNSIIAGSNVPVFIWRFIYCSWIWIYIFITCKGTILILSTILIILNKCIIILLQSNTSVLCYNHRFKTSGFRSISIHTTHTINWSQWYVEDIRRSRCNSINLKINCWTCYRRKCIYRCI